MVEVGFFSPEKSLITIGVTTISPTNIGPKEEQTTNALATNKPFVYDVLTHGRQVRHSVKVFRSCTLFPIERFVNSPVPVNSSGLKFLFHIRKCHIIPVAWVLEHLSNLVKRRNFPNIHMIHRCTRRWARPISLWMVGWNKGHWVAAPNPGVLTFVNRNVQKRWNGCFQKYGKTPKSWIWIGFSIIFTIHFGGPPLFLETPKCWLFLWDEGLGQLSRSKWSVFFGPGAGWKWLEDSICETIIEWLIQFSVFRFPGLNNADFSDPEKFQFKSWFAGCEFRRWGQQSEFRYCFMLFYFYSFNCFSMVNRNLHNIPLLLLVRLLVTGKKLIILSQTSNSINLLFTACMLVSCSGKLSTLGTACVWLHSHIYIYIIKKWVIWVV